MSYESKREHELVKRLIEVEQEIIKSETPKQEKLKSKKSSLKHELTARIKNEYDINLDYKLELSGNGIAFVFPEGQEISDEAFNKLPSILGFTDSYKSSNKEITFGFFTDWEYAPEELKELVK